MVDNLFVVESPLQALIALELSFHFKNENNGIVYRLSENRERNSKQIKNIINKGSWYFKRKVLFKEDNLIKTHLSILRELKYFRLGSGSGVKRLFIGEFRSQWMHFMRAAVKPAKTILMDDGAATLTVKNRYLDKGFYFPMEVGGWKVELKNFIKSQIYSKYWKSTFLKQPFDIASAFLKSESIYPIDFSNLKKIFKSKIKSEDKKIFYFGSKYSESGLVSEEYELDFICQIIDFYKSYSVDIVYCAHRDESDKKLAIIREKLGLKVMTPEVPGEVFLIENSANVLEVAGAYSSILNNAPFILSDVQVRSFLLDLSEISGDNVQDIAKVYQHFENSGVLIEKVT